MVVTLQVDCPKEIAPNLEAALANCLQQIGSDETVQLLSLCTLTFNRETWYIFHHTVEYTCEAFRLIPADLAKNDSFGGRRVEAMATITFILYYNHGFTVPELVRILGRDKSLISKYKDRAYTWKSDASRPGRAFDIDRKRYERIQSINQKVNRQIQLRKNPQNASE